MNLEVKTTQVKVPANAVLNTKEKVLNYLVIGTGTEAVTLNVGEKTIEGINKLLKTK